MARLKNLLHIGQQLAAQGAKFGAAVVYGGQADRAQYAVRYRAGAGNLQVVAPGRVLVQWKHGASWERS